MKSPLARETPNLIDPILLWFKASPVRRGLGLLINVVGLMVAIYALVHSVITIPHVSMAAVGGLAAAACTGLGACFIIFFRNISQKLQDCLMGFGAGVMLAACSFSLIIPGIEASEGLGYAGYEAASIIGLSILLGVGFMLLIDNQLPHEHFIKGLEGPHSALIRRTWLFIFAIALHNFPEGMAIGVAYASSPEAGLSLATGISIQDIPEGLVVALALVAAGYRKSSAVLVGILTGLIEPVGAIIGAAVIGHAAYLLPWGLGLSAGAMLFVISHEIIPETHRKGHEITATLGLTVGFVIMMVLDNAFH
jgi:ZIP family zinc transporter